MQSHTHGHDAGGVLCGHTEKLTSAVDGTVGSWGVRGQREQADPTVWILTHHSQPRVLHTKTRTGRKSNY